MEDLSAGAMLMEGLSGQSDQEALSTSSECNLPENDRTLKVQIRRILMTATILYISAAQTEH